MKVRRAQGPAVASQPIHLMLRGAQFKVLRQLKTDSDRTVVSNWRHGRGVGELGDISSKAEFRLEKYEEMPRRGTAQGLKLNVRAVEIASGGRARGSRPASAGRLRQRTSAKVRRAGRRRDFDIRAATTPVARAQC